MKKTILVVSLLFCSIAVFAQAPYVIDNNTVKCCGGNDLGMGSSFLATYDGQLDSVDVILRNGSPSNGTFYLYDGNGVTTQLHTQTLTGIPQALNEVYRIRLNAQMVLAANHTYTFMVHGTPIRFGYSNTYADGSLWAQTTEQTSQDLDFVAYIGPVIIDRVLDGKSNESISVFVDASGNIQTNASNVDEMVLIAMNGKIVAQSNNSTIPASSVPSGLYAVSVRSGEVVKTVRLVVQ